MKSLDISTSNIKINGEVAYLNDKTDPRIDLISTAKASMAHRRFYNYSMFDFGYNILCCVKCLSPHKEKRFSYFNRYQLYEKGVDKYLKEFDAEYYTKSLRNLKMLVSSLMDDSERFMNLYQHSNTISLLKLESGNDSDDEQEKKIPKLSSKQMKEEKHKESIDGFFDSYLKEKLSAKDFKLLKGAYTQQKLKNNELENLNPDKLDSIEDDDDQSQVVINPKTSMKLSKAMTGTSRNKVS